MESTARASDDLVHIEALKLSHEGMRFGLFPHNYSCNRW